METIFIGYIAEATVLDIEGERDKMFAKANDAVFASLPTEQKGLEGQGNRFIYREMFHTHGKSREPSLGAYRGRIFTFGGRGSYLELDWHLWLESFETLLQQLYCDKAYVRLIPEYMLPSDFNWEVPSDHWMECFSVEHPHPPSQWVFEGPFRKFGEFKKAT